MEGVAVTRSRVRGAEEVSTRPDLGDRVERERVVGEVERGQELRDHLQEIDVDDRLLLTPSINTTAAQRAQLAAIGYNNGASVQQVRFFQNKK